jgi:adenine-specific DNA-methyltransferase
VDFDMTERTLEDFISNIKTDRREEDVLYEILLKYGLDLTLPITEHVIAGQKVFDIGMGALIICLADAISLEVVEGIAKLKDELGPEIMRVVFKDSGFKDDVVKTNAVQILRTAGIVDVRSL